MKRFLSAISMTAGLVVFQSVGYAPAGYAQSAADLLPSWLEPSQSESSQLDQLAEAAPEQIAQQSPLEVRRADEDFLPPTAEEGDWRVDVLPDLARDSGCASSSSSLVIVCFSTRH